MQITRIGGQDHINVKFDNICAECSAGYRREAISRRFFFDDSCLHVLNEGIVSPVFSDIYFARTGPCCFGRKGERLKLDFFVRLK